MTQLVGLDRDRIRDLFDLRSAHNERSGGGYREDPYPAFQRLREAGPVHAGTVHDLVGYPGEFFFEGLPHPDRPHFSAFSFAACDDAFRDTDTFRSSPELSGAGEGAVVALGVEDSLLAMGGMEHRRYRGLVQPSFIPARVRWWTEQWIQETVDALVGQLKEAGSGELNVDFCAAIPVLTITGSFGIPVAQALDLRESLRGDQQGALTTFVELLAPIVAARREQAQDDLISVLVEAEFQDDDGVRHRLSDAEIYSFSFLLLAAGSGTTWKQMGITLAALLTNPALLDAARQDPKVLRAAVEEGLRWTATDPVFARFVSRDVPDFHGISLPKGSVLHMCLGAANRDPARWADPDRFDPYRAPRSALAFGSGPHICLGMHVARAEMLTGIGALLDSLPNLRLDPDAPTPEIIGLYERGPTELYVSFD
jgi:cytochrome P450